MPIYDYLRGNDFRGNTKCPGMGFRAEDLVSRKMILTCPAVADI